jgi:C4-dicarboxylate-binding protein DctP
MRKASIAAAAIIAIGVFGAAEAAERLRISLDTNPSHVRNKGVQLFVDALKARVGDEIDVEVYPSAQLYRDRDVGRALRQGSVEMAMPGTWVLDGSVPEAAVTSLPMFYGLSEDAAIALTDGELGQAVNAKIGEQLRAHVLGPWMNMGFLHFYSTNRPLETHEDLAGLRIRFPGGSANARRVEEFGAVPNLIAWPDVPLALSTDVVDGIASTHESIASAQLWDSGIRHAFEDNQYFLQYVPMVSQQFWNGLSEEHRTAMTEAWAEVVDDLRAMARNAQAEAREVLISNGITITTPTAEELSGRREKLLESQDQLVREMNIDVSLIEMATTEVN